VVIHREEREGREGREGKKDKNNVHQRIEYSNSLLFFFLLRVLCVLRGKSL